MKYILCTQCNEDLEEKKRYQTRVYTKNITQARGQCISCGKTKIGCTIDQTRNKPEYEETKKEAFICPHCEEEIDKFYYSEDGYQHGEVNLQLEDFQNDGFECNGDTTFRCPECDEEINERTINNWNKPQPIIEKPDNLTE